MRIIPTEYVKDGDILGENLYTTKGIILIRAGKTLNSSLVRKINDHKIYSVYINNIHSDLEIAPLLEQSLRLKGILLIKKLFDAAIANTEILSIHNEILAYTDDVLYEINAIRNNQIEYIDIKNVEIYQYSSALMAAILAWDLKLNKEMVKQVFIGGIYHDIGIAMLPDNIASKTSDLTNEEKMMIIMHPVSGHKYLKDRTFISAYIKAITFHHHEHIDGTGYPNRIKGKDINNLAQIIGIVDIYDAMTSDRPYRRSVSSKEAIEYIMGAAGTHFDYEIASAFIKKINPYPKGSLIELNDGRCAVVDSVPENLPMRPTIKIITKTGDDFSYETMDLRNNQNIVVNNIIYELKD